MFHACSRFALVLVAVGAASGVASGAVISQATTGVSYQYNETSFRDSVAINTSGSLAGTNDGSLELLVNAPSGQVFSFDSSAYPGVGMEFVTSYGITILGVLAADITATDPTLDLIGASGVSLTFVSASVAETPTDPNTNFTFNATYAITGTGTFSGFKQTIQFANGDPTGQTVNWTGGSVYVAPAGSAAVADSGPVLTVVPEPASFLPSVAIAGGLGLVVNRMRRRRRAG